MEPVKRAFPAPLLTRPSQPLRVDAIRGLTERERDKTSRIRAGKIEAFGQRSKQIDGYLSWASSPRVYIMQAQIIQSTSGYSALDHVDEDPASAVPVIAGHRVVGTARSLFCAP